MPVPWMLWDEGHLIKISDPLGTDHRELFTRGRQLIGTGRRFQGPEIRFQHKKNREVPW